MSETRCQLKTAHGIIRYPAYIPVTTFGTKYPLDGLIQPYLRRLSQAVMVSLYYARQMKQRPNLPLLVDSGGFAALFQGARVVEEHGLGVLEVPAHEGIERLHPAEVLDFQETHADLAFTLDFPIPPQTDPAEAARRQELTIANALWALNNRRRGAGLPLFACIQAWDEKSAGRCASALAAHSFSGFAIGGLVPRARDIQLIEGMIEAVQGEIGDRPLHVFGLGKPELVSRLFDLGVDSVDSSSYVKLAADGRLWEAPDFQLPDPTPTDRLHFALRNLAAATRSRTPLSTYSGFLARPLTKSAGTVDSTRWRKGSRMANQSIYHTD
jgi:tRNA-guanine family transglycosylase